MDADIERLDRWVPRVCQQAGEFPLGEGLRASTIKGGNFSPIHHHYRFVTLMPPRWPRKPDRKDPAFRRLDDRMNFATHVAIFAAINSGIWFFQGLQPQAWSWPLGFTGIWLAVLVAHAIYIFAIADYSPSPPSSPNSSG